MPITHNPFMMYIAIKTSLQIIKWFVSPSEMLPPIIAKERLNYHDYYIIKKLTSQPISPWAVCFVRKI